MATITVLSIDGGGIRGMIPAAFLNRLEQAAGRRVSELFDYIAGTSTGGILALGLGVNRPGGQAPYTAAELMDLYQKEGEHIFSRSFFHTVGAVGNLNGPKYPEDGVDATLQNYFRGARLKDARTNVLVTAYEIERRCPFFFRSWQAQAAETNQTHDFAVWQVARSTSAAPTYFPPQRAEAADGTSYALIDGGVYANNPALCAWVEAHDRHPGADILVVSVGTGNEERPVRFDDARNWGVVGWAPRLIDIIFDGVSDTVEVELEEMLNTRGAHNHYRFQSKIDDAQQDLDNTDPGNLAALKKVGEGLAEGNDFAEVRARLRTVLAERTAQSQPVPLPPVEKRMFA
jgi:patatin-like phospholipase/acyl hydrolase